MNIDFKKGRTAVLGTTGTGKTVSTLVSLVRQKIPFIFIDTINMNTSNLPIEVKNNVYIISENTSMNKIKLIMQRDNLFLKFQDYYNKELFITFLLNYILDEMKAHEFYVCIDEVHLYTRKGQQAIERLATTGRNFNKYLIALSQAPQQVSNVILRQSEQKILFNMDMQKGWFKEYGLPFEEYLERLAGKDIHHFVAYENLSKVLTEPRKVDL